MASYIIHNAINSQNHKKRPKSLKCKKIKNKKLTYDNTNVQGLSLVIKGNNGFKVNKTGMIVLLFFLKEQLQ